MKESLQNISFTHGHTQRDWLLPSLRRFAQPFPHCSPGQGFPPSLESEHLCHSGCGPSGLLTASFTPTGASLSWVQSSCPCPLPSVHAYAACTLIHPILARITAVTSSLTPCGFQSIHLAKPFPALRCFQAPWLPDGEL